MENTENMANMVSMETTASADLPPNPCHIEEIRNGRSE